MRLKSLFYGSVGLGFTLLISLLGLQWALLSHHEGISQAHVIRHESLSLADQLRRSSDELTRMARTFVVTGDPIFEKHFNEILAIRNGESKRPENYEQVYWDFLIAGEAPAPGENSISLKEMMKSVGIKEDEFELIQNAHIESDRLVSLERTAMNAAKGLFLDERGNFTVRREPDFELARELMFSEEYHLAKAAIMKPINDFYNAIDRRTESEVAAISESAKAYRSSSLLFLFACFGCYLLFLIIFYNRVLRPLLGFVRTTKKVSSGDFSNRISHPHNDEIGLLASSFNEMMDFVGDVNHQLEMKVAEALSEQKKEEAARLKLEKKIAQSQKLEAIGTLAGGIAHDFNNILAAIIGYSEIAIMEIEELGFEKAHPLRDSLDNVLTGGHRAKDLVKQILTFSRQKEKEVVPVKISLVLKEAIKLLRASTPTTIEFRQEIDSKANVMADPTEIHQVFMNLCTNAVKAMPDGGTLEVCLTEELLDDDFVSRHPELSIGNHLRIAITDTGVGMTPEVKAKIFDPFFTTRSKDEGTGLGLSVVHGIVRDCKGTIVAYSEPGQGSTFVVLLPVTHGAEGIEQPQVESLPRGSERIMFVDDEEPLTKIGKTILGKLGYKVECFTRSPEAMEEFIKNPDSYDLIITDMTMPDLTGDLMSQRMIEARADIPIIVCTGYSEKLTSERAKEIGIKKFIMKPLIATKLASAVRQVLDEKS